MQYRKYYAISSFVPRCLIKNQILFLGGMGTSASAHKTVVKSIFCRILHLKGLYWEHLICILIIAKDIKLSFSIFSLIRLLAISIINRGLYRTTTSIIFRLQINRIEEFVYQKINSSIMNLKLILNILIRYIYYALSCKLVICIYVQGNNSQSSQLGKNEKMRLLDRTIKAEGKALDCENRIKCLERELGLIFVVFAFLSFELSNFATMTYQQKWDGFQNSINGKFKNIYFLVFEEVIFQREITKIGDFIDRFFSKI
uniref:Uncharacterized protein n=1 Tax=Heterorhabditis bacteriophora TaxID=37862 RepID=A0A1I7WEC9_HETBA